LARRGKSVREKKTGPKKPEKRGEAEGGVKIGNVLLIRNANIRKKNYLGKNHLGGKRTPQKKKLTEEVQRGEGDKIERKMELFSSPTSAAVRGKLD